MSRGDERDMSSSGSSSPFVIGTGTVVTTGRTRSDAAAEPGFCRAPPPPPLPPSAMPGQAPALRISAVETAVRGQPLSNKTRASDNPYEPPAAIQNAMMTKDKKPFTYTPGMGGKLDLSQIRSPRMARRVAKNANDEGIEGPPKSCPTAAEPRTVLPYAQPPQVAVPVFPTDLSTDRTTSESTVGRLPFNERNTGMERPMTKHAPLIMSSSQPNSEKSSPSSPSPSPQQVTLAKAPTPWLQKKNKLQEQQQRQELPEWVKRGSSASPNSPTDRNDDKQRSFAPLIEAEHSHREHVIPLRIEERPSVFGSIKKDERPSSSSSCHHRQRWGNGTSAASTCQSSGTYIVPIAVEANSHDNRAIGATPSPARTTTNEPGPVQSRSFRVLQKITDTDESAAAAAAAAAADQVDPQQLRKLRLDDNDKILMNKLKERVDDTYLHQEEDPRYRGATIPSRAFRYLQNITDSGDASSSTTSVSPTGASATVNKMRQQNRNSPPSFDEPRANVPANEKQAPEPKKYTGSAIPSRSFRILQAMTSPIESIGPDETDY